MNDFINAIKKPIFQKDIILTLFDKLTKTQKEKIITFFGDSKKWEDLDNFGKALFIRRNAFSLSSILKDS